MTTYPLLSLLQFFLSSSSGDPLFPLMQLNFLVTENRQREIVDQQCEGVQAESLDALLSVAIQCVSSSPEDRPTMHRVLQLLESEVMTPCPSDFYDSNSDWKPCAKDNGMEFVHIDAMQPFKGLKICKASLRHYICSFFLQIPWLILLHHLCPFHLFLSILLVINGNQGTFLSPREWISTWFELFIQSPPSSSSPSLFPFS